MKPSRAVTLLELLIAIILFSTIAIGFYSIDLFSRNQVISSQNQAQVQDEASIALAHITKQVMRGVGDVNNLPVTITTIGGDNAVLVWIDYDNNGIRTAGDKQIAYRYKDSTDYQLWFYSNYTDNPGSYEVIARKIRPDFSTNINQPTYVTYSSTNNYITVQVTACWDPSGSSYACGTVKNPQVTMSTKIKIPAVSLN